MTMTPHFRFHSARIVILTIAIASCGGSGGASSRIEDAPPTFDADVDPTQPMISDAAGPASADGSVDVPIQIDAGPPDAAVDPGSDAAPADSSPPIDAAVAAGDAGLDTCSLRVTRSGNPSTTFLVVTIRISCLSDPATSLVRIFDGRSVLAQNFDPQPCGSSTVVFLLLSLPADPSAGAAFLGQDGVGYGCSGRP